MAVRKQREGMGWDGMGREGCERIQIEVEKMRLGARQKLTWEVEKKEVTTIGADEEQNDGKK